MKELVYKYDMDWEGTVYKHELYFSKELDVSPVTQVQAVCLTDSDHAVLFEHKKGWFGLPGGSLDEGESFEESLKREIMEETACEMLSFGNLGYVKVWPEKNPEKVDYQLRFWAKVKPLDQSVDDPVKKAIARHVCDIDEAIKKLDWGERGKILVEGAIAAYKEAKA